MFKKAEACVTQGRPFIWGVCVCVLGAAVLLIHVFELQCPLIVEYPVESGGDGH